MTPAAAAAAAASDAEQAEQTGQHLHQALDDAPGTAASRHRPRATATRNSPPQAPPSNSTRRKTSTGELARITAAAAELTACEAQAAQAKQSCGNQRDATPARQLAAAAPRRPHPGVTRLSGHAPGRRCPAGSTSWPQTRRSSTRTPTRSLNRPGSWKKPRRRLSDLQALASSLAEGATPRHSELEEYRQALGRLQDATSTALREAATPGRAQREEEQALAGCRRPSGSTISPLEAAAEAAAGDELRSAEDSSPRSAAMTPPTRPGQDYQPASPA